MFVNQITAYHSIAGLVDGRIGRGVLKTDNVDSDVVVVVDDIMCDTKLVTFPFTTSDSLEPVLR